VIDLDKILFIDIETDHNGNILMVGCMDKDKYMFFNTAIDFYNFYKKSDYKKIYAYNLEFDFFRIYQDFNEDIKKEFRFRAMFNTAGVIYIQQGKRYWYDLMLHYSSGLKSFGEIIGLKKLNIDYNKMVLNSDLIEYNKRDLELTREMYIQLNNIYNQEGNKFKASISSVAFEIFNKKFYGGTYKKIDQQVKNDWRMAYKGGLCEVYATGHFYAKSNKMFVLIDVNSLYPYVMINQYPDPYDYIKIDKDKFNKNMINDKDWLAVSYMNNIGYTNIEYNIEDIDFDIIYIFNKKCYPFKRFIEYFYNKKEKAKNKFERFIYKRIMNSLYGKFGQKDSVEVIISNPDKKILHKKNILSYEQIYEGLYKIEMKSDKYFSNIIWSVWTCAMARRKMRNDIEFFRNYCDVYYIDTDGLIIETDKKTLKMFEKEKIICNEIGWYKIEAVAKVLKILGKKMYIIGDMIKVKGIEKNKQQEFINNGKVECERMIKLRTALKKNKKIGSFEKRLIINKNNQIDP